MSQRTNTATQINGRWVIKVQKNGVRKSFYSSRPGRAGQREANAKADAWLDGDLIDSRSRVRQLWPDYLADVEARSGYSNYRQVKSIGDSYILPLLGNRAVADLTVGDLQSLVNKAYKHGAYNNSGTRPLLPGETLSRKTLKNLVFTLKNFIKYCRIIAHATMLNPETLCVPAGSRLQEKHILQPEALQTLFSSDITTFREKPRRDDLIHAYRLAVLTGLRPGEVIGLHWGDIAPNDAALHLRRAINIHGEETHGKNENAVRAIPLTAYSRSVIAAQRAQTITEGCDITANEPVFNISCEQTFLKRWYRYCDANGIDRVTLYELRHTFVSIASLLPAGEVKGIVGHSRNMDTFGVYGHKVKAYDQVISDDLYEVFERLLG